MSPTLLLHIEELRKIILALKAVGDQGFEGLVAEVLAAFSGLTIRLAKSGSQFGRDGSSATATFAIAMEAKRYSDDLRLEVLAGKVLVGANVLQDRIDVWVLGATSEVGDDVLQKLGDILEEYGVTLLALDWAARPLPPLPVVLAAMKDVTLNWFDANVPSVDRSVLAGHLDAIVGDPAFQSQCDALLESVTLGSVGLDALRRKSSTWLRKRLVDDTLCQVAFGQRLTVAKPGSYVQVRGPLVQELGGKLAKPGMSDRAIVAVLGEEGAGKTWLVAQWFERLAEPPIVLFVAGRNVQHLLPGMPTETIARLLAQQSGLVDDRAIQRWAKRLHRWKKNAVNDAVRFVVVLDGINQHPTLPWADLIKELALEVEALGGILVVTSRAVFWHRVASRLKGLFDVRLVEVSGYSDSELHEVLAANRIEVKEISYKVREFIRNPRICAIAIRLLDRLVIPNELTVDRLLMEYWRWQLEERGDLVSHDLPDFQKLLRSHAEAWLKNQGEPFELDKWLEHSGRAKRLGIEQVRNDVTEIEDGRFFQLAKGDAGTYEFRPEGLPYALGLLINDELRKCWKKWGASSEEDVWRIIDPIRGFDRTADILAAATMLAALDDSFPSFGRQSLIGVWAGLQNIDQDTIEVMEVYVPLCPDAFLDVIEWPASRAENLPNHAALVDLVLAVRDLATVQEALASRVSRWLSGWTRQTEPGPDQVKQQANRDSRVGVELSTMSAPAMKAFGRLTVEWPEWPSIELDRAATFLLAGRALAGHAHGLLGWYLVRSVVGGGYKTHESIQWIVRLGTTDWSATGDGVKRLVDGLGDASSEILNRASAGVLRMLGDKLSSDLADNLNPTTGGKTVRSIAHFCDTNPHDPDAPEGSNIDNSRAAAASLEAEKTWASLSRTVEDTTIERITPALARFEPSTIIKLVNSLAWTAAGRSASALRQLSWRLPENSPILDEGSIKAALDALDRLRADPSMVQSTELTLISSWLIHAIAPHLTPGEQLDLILSIPAGPLPLTLRYCLKPLPGDALEKQLESTLRGSFGQELGRTLFFASATKPGLTTRAREIVVDSFWSDDGLVSAAASDVILVANDADLDDLFLSRLDHRGFKEKEEEGGPRHRSYEGRAIAAVVMRRKRASLFALVPPTYLSALIDGTSEPALELLAGHIGRMVERLLKPVSPNMPPDVVLEAQLSSDWLTFENSVEDSSLAAVNPNIAQILDEVNNPRASIDRFAERQKAMIDGLQKYEAALAFNGATELLIGLPPQGVRHLISRNPVQCERWINLILSTTDLDIKQQIRNLGLSLASAYVDRDAVRAASVFRHLKDVKPFINIQSGPNRLPWLDCMLFSAPSNDPIDAVRCELFDAFYSDDQIEAGVFAAETHGAGAWLDRYVERLVTADHPGLNARGLTIAGFRRVNSQSETVLGAELGNGFLGKVRAYAQKCYSRACWAQHWLKLACETTEPHDFWRFSTLAAGVADGRVLRILEDELTPNLKVYADDLFDRLKAAAEERTKNRAKTLFGLPAPEKDLVELLATQPGGFK